MKTVILCRHGDVENPDKIFYGRGIPVPLSDLGKKQIASIGKQIGEMEIDVHTIYTSPLLRTIETSEILATYLHVPIVQQEGIIEVDIPALVGKPNHIRKELHDRGEDEYSSEWVAKGHESTAAVSKRMIRAYKSIMEECGENIPLLVSHGDPLAFLLYQLENPGKDIPLIGLILTQGYGLPKGHGILVTFDDDGKVIEKIPLIPSVS